VSTGKKHYHRPRRRFSSPKKKRANLKPDYGTPKIDPSLRPVFDKIGVPRSGTFQADPFQLKALDLIKDYDLVVSAPTGAGKTWIATQAIHAYLAAGLRVWYASPLKALSNSIYQEFCGEFGVPDCGILTGDRKENPEAPILVGTTEILRNQLYDAMHEGSRIPVDLVILDEAHYLNDPERGVVWEEVLIYLPSRVRLLLLSATISNAEEVCDWLWKVRGTPNKVVCSEERPVPLETLFLFPGGLVVPLSGKKGLSPKIKRFLSTRSGRRGRRSEKIDFGEIIRYLRAFDLLPAIFFLKSRADCDRAILTCPPVEKGSRTQASLRKAVRKFLGNYPHLTGHRQMGPLLESRVASHHGGQLPFWKVLVEKMMNKGYLEAIFSTSTVAAGVNFPARTVVLVQSDRYNGHEFVDLTATDLHQMIGRAGRRGKDHIGFAMLLPSRYQNPQLILELQDSPPEPLLSQIYINFSMALNLLLSHTPAEVKYLLERSFAAFQSGESGASRLWSSFNRHLRFLKETGFVDGGDRLTADGDWAAKLRLDQPLLIAEAIRRGALDNISSTLLAGGLAPFVWDRVQEVDLRTQERVSLTNIETLFKRILRQIAEIRRLKGKKGFDIPPIPFWPAGALFMWAKGISWEQLLAWVRVDEGDMASLIMRTADHLRQVTNLRETHPRLAGVAEEAIERILREPVYIS
jgi:ATP-dependent RNA helicase HelY